MMRVAFAILFGLILIAPGVRAATQQPADFKRWLDGVAVEASHRGVKLALAKATLANVSFRPRVVQNDRNQAEFIEPLAKYLGRHASDNTIALGQAALAQWQDTLLKVEKTYGVPSQIIVAIWGMESGYGRAQGNYPVIDALATRAFQRQSDKWLRDHLIYALQAVQKYHLDPKTMLGSWGGAMGQPQFMPQAYISYAVDFDKDGKADIWGSPADVFASIANYLKENGWQPGYLWGREVTVPPDFDYGLSDGTTLPMGEWAAKGVVRASGLDLPDTGNMEARLLTPSGTQGPAFLVYDNFDAIRRYNASDAYALTVAYLADRIVGRPPLTNLQPTDDLEVTNGELEEMQKKLVKLGFDPGEVDGMMGGQTRKAVLAFQRANHLKPDDGIPTRHVLQALRAAVPSLPNAPAPAAKSGKPSGATGNSGAVPVPVPRG